MRVIALDSETHLIKPGLLAPPLVCVSVAERVPGWIGLVKTLLGAQDGLEYVRSLLVDPDVLLVFLNAPFDLAVFCAEDPDIIPLVFKAYAANRIIDIGAREELKDIADGRMDKNGKPLVNRDGEWVPTDYSLNGITKHYQGKDRTEDKKGKDSWRLRYASLKHLPVQQWPEAARKYALEDAEDTLVDYELIGPAMPTEDVQTKAAWALHLQSVWGVRTEAESVAKLKTELLTAQAANRRRLIQAGILVKERMTPGQMKEKEPDFWEDVVVTKPLTKFQNKIAGKNEFGGGWVEIEVSGEWLRRKVVTTPFRWKKDTKKLKAYVERVLKRQGKPTPQTATQETSTDKETLEATGSRLLQLVADGGGVDKILSTYVPALEQGTQVPINTRYRVLVNSGRTSSSAPNLQNVPTGRRVGGVRECIIPRPGYVFVSCDYKMLEMTHIAQVCWTLFGESRMREEIDKGRDLHLVFAADLLKLTYEETLARYEEGDKEIKKARNFAKVANFGLPGGLGVQSLVDYAWSNYKIRITESEAYELKQNWMRTWPEMQKFFRYINDKVRFGKATLAHPLTGYVRGGVGYTDGCNQLFQHPAAYGAKLALFQVAYESYVDCGTALFGSRPVLFIHDEIIAEVPEENAHAASYRLAEIMVEEMKKVTPDVAQEVKPALMNRWWKEAATVHDAEGNLVAWEPKAA